MQSTYNSITPFSKLVSVVSNHLDIKVDYTHRALAKYKKVSKHTKDQLIQLVLAGQTIINAARTLNINYSTAKSIVQSYKFDPTKTESVEKSKTHSTEDSASPISNSTIIHHQQQLQPIHH